MCVCVCVRVNPQFYQCLLGAAANSVFIGSVVWTTTPIMQQRLLETVLKKRQRQLLKKVNWTVDALNVQDIFICFRSII